MKRISRLLIVSALAVITSLLAMTLVMAQDGTTSAAEFGTQINVAPSGGTVCGGNAGSVGIIHDDGTFENGYAGNPASVTVFQNVDLFNPVGPSYAYTRFCVGLVSLAGTTLNFEIVFYDNNGTSGAPGTELAAVPASASNIPNNLPCGWYEYDLTSATSLPTGTDGDIYIGVRYNPATYPSVFTCADQSVTTPLWTGYTQFNASGWGTTQSVFTSFRAMSHRVEMDEPLVPAIVMTKTVGTDPTSCATGSTISVPYGSTVYYCYTVENTGNVTLTHHTVVDDMLGTVLGPAAPYSLAPGATYAFTTTDVLNANSVTNVATWTAFISGTQVTASGTATATVTGTPTDVSLTEFAGQSGNTMWIVLVAVGMVMFAGMIYVRRQTN